MLYTRAVPRPEPQEFALGTVGSCVLKVTVPNIVMAEVTTCSVRRIERYQPFFASRSVEEGVALEEMPSREFLHRVATPPQVAASSVSHALDTVRGWFTSGEQSEVRIAGQDETEAQAEAIDTFLEHLTVSPVRNSRVAEIAFRSEEPRRCT